MFIHNMGNINKFNKIFIFVIIRIFILKTATVIEFKTFIKYLAKHIILVLLVKP